MTLREILDAVAKGELGAEVAERHLSGHGFVQAGFHRLDTHREGRTGLPEVVLGARKTIEQLDEIITFFEERKFPLFLTRISQEKSAKLLQLHPDLVFDRVAGTLRLGHAANPVSGEVALVTAGSSDQPVAEEAASTLDYFGITPVRVYDCGVAGMHRLFASGDVIASCPVIIAVAGMEGALPSVMGGLFERPIIAVPTSVGYGASFEGLSALLAMMNSCAPGITVVNIDNGFGAAVAARSILRLAAH
jgi:pyridinium-3,5-biscarboxylic acid mononucleotide synthase